MRKISSEIIEECIYIYLNQMQIAVQTRVLFDVRELFEELTPHLTGRARSLFLRSARQHFRTVPKLIIGVQLCPKKVACTQKEK